METKMCLLVLCGIPGSGKSTLCQQMMGVQPIGDQTPERDVEDILEKTIVQNDLPNWNYEIAVISYDDLIPEDIERELIASETDGESGWKRYREKIMICVNDLIERIQCRENPSNEVTDKELWDRFCEKVNFPSRGGSSGGVVIVIDDNMYYSSMRYKYYQLARKFTCGFCQVFVDCSVEVALERNSKRTTRKIPHSVIVTMSTKFEVPNPNENSWEKYTLTLKTGDVLQNMKQSFTLDLITMIDKAMNDPVQPIPEEDTEGKEISRQICSENIIYQADQVIRKLIGQSMAKYKGTGLSKEQMQTLSKQLMNVKSLILESLRSGEITVSQPENCDHTNELKHLHGKITSEFERHVSDIIHNLR